MNRANQGGFSLIEVVVTGAILTVGLLGLAGLQLRALNAEAESYARGQALMLVDQMAERIVARKDAAITGAYSQDVSYGYGTVEDCTLMVDGVDRDLCLWSADINAGTRVAAGGVASSIGVLTTPIGCVSWDAGNLTYLVSISWLSRDTLPGSTQPVIACAEVAAMAPQSRRTVLRSVRLATLDAS